MNLTYHMILFGVLLLATVGLFLYRRWLENHGDHYIHLHDDSHDMTIVNSQTTMCKRCETVDKIKNAVLAATVIYGIIIAAYASYQAWTQSGL